MSIEERLEELRRTRTEENNLIKAAEEKAEAERSETYRDTFDGARSKQAVLLEGLRKLGIVEIIEEFTGQSIPPIVAENSGRQSLTAEKVKRFQQLFDQGEIRKLLIERETRKWEVHILLPAMSDTGEADPTLVIQLIQLNKNLLNPADLNKSVAKVSVSYDNDQRLWIKGAEVTFNSKIPNGEPEQVAIVERALTLAVDQPEPLPSSSIFQGPSNNIPIKVGA